MMRIVFGGVRGTSPISNCDALTYGGATTSLLIEDGAGGRILIDAGTGLRNVQPHVSAASATAPVLMLLTHYHLDHLIGLPSFAPLYDPDYAITFAAPNREGVSVEQALTRLIEKPFWPIPFYAQRRFLILPDTPENNNPLYHGEFIIRWCAVHHANGCHAYRLDNVKTGESLVFATDLEWQASNPAEREAFLSLCRTPHPAGILIMDGQFDAAEASRYAGWGHSTWQDTVEVAWATGIQRLVVTHHAPDLNDQALVLREAELKKTMLKACLAREGMEIIKRKQL